MGTRTKKRKLLLMLAAMFVLVGSTGYIVNYLKNRSVAPEESSAAQQVPTLSKIPDSPVKVKNPGGWTLTKNNTYSPGTPAPAGLNEANVFHTELVHNESAQNSWKLRVGNGSQIYSIRTSQGELIAEPYTAIGDQWNDGVLQTAFTNVAKNKTGKIYDIHQAGTYVRDGLSKSFYSPIVWESFDKQNKNYTTTVWSQHAHIPTDYKSRVIVEQEIRDIGDGVIEITYYYYNAQGETLDYILTPWSGFRYTTNPVLIVSKADKGYKVENLERSDSNWVHTYKSTETNGWMAYTASANSSAKGIGIVFGKTKYAGTSFERREKGIMTGPLKSVDLFVFGIQSLVSLEQNSGMYYRYYVIINTLDKIQKYGNELTEKVDYGPIEFTHDTANTQAVCQTSNKVITTDCPGKTPIFYSYVHPINKAQPIFVLKNNNTNDIIYTDNPYELSSKPYDGKTTYKQLIGWAIPSAQKNDCYTYKKLTDLIGTSYKGNSNLVVLTDLNNKCTSKDCSDGTKNNTCSSAKPKYCKDGSLMNKCSSCGCRADYTCQTDESCTPTPDIQTENTCNDGTSYNSCSSTKPLYCFDGNLVNKCSLCGCAGNYTCQSDQSCNQNKPSDLPACGPMDVNGDKKLTLLDLALFSKIFNQKCKDEVIYSDCGSRDTNKDGIIDWTDLADFIGKYAKQSC